MSDSLHQQPAVNQADPDDQLVSDTSPHGSTSDKTFADFGLRDDMVQALVAKGIVSPFPIQAMTLPIALAGQDIIGQAKTGTGKTLGFGLPVLERVIGPDEPGSDSLPSPGAPQALVIVPTRELATQVGEDLGLAASRRSVRVTTIYGGRAYEPQVDELNRGTEVVVGTPGRLIDLMRQRHLSFDHVQTVVLDEADEMLDLGFLPDVETLLQAVPDKRQTMLFSATMPGPVVAMARRFMTHPTHIRAEDPDDTQATKKDIRQLIYRAHHLDKDELIARVLQARERGRTIIFTRTKRAAARLTDELTRRGFAAGAIHGDLGQGAREQALRAFRNEKIDVLVATDVAARGIDVDDVTHVINFQCPEDEKTYLHRIGRTGRAGHKGTAVTLVDWEDIPQWKLIAASLGLDQTEPIETYSASPHLFEDLDIPEGTKGKLPKSQRTHAGLDAEDREDLGGKDSRSRSRNGRQHRRGRSRRRSAGHQQDQSQERSSSSKHKAQAKKEKASGSSRRRQRTRRKNGKVVSSRRKQSTNQQNNRN
ncbi:MULTISPECIES: DEAD/DEAH box helicase [Auritidibacter]|uniref:DEAD/DEAH box helicase n=1 Tax=Auritidibacter TaxID=1160973 RepID=UPI000D734EC3|nr:MULTISPECIES: DEAD/DEAH box helicase [Auritidibacter]NIH71578.1 superfamily II DNA/RNA helicase [Auritidibacter ignavus]PXA77408.1 DNA helicase [Auritidibacter sp. NML100628]RMX24268.1 DEAD/DEAH box helicase [Auritidibacter ignavus]